MLEAWERLGHQVRCLGIPVGPCLSIAALEGFEGRHGIRLPEDYRWFLTHVGNGCVGPPHFGLVPLGETWGLPDLPAWHEFWGDLPAVAKPFPFTQAWCWAQDESEPTGDDLLTRVWPGTIYLGTDGCAMTHHLVVSGPDRGHVWEFRDVGIFPHEGGQTFTGWFAQWLESGQVAEYRRPLEHPDYDEFRCWLAKSSAEPAAAPDGPSKPGPPVS